MVLISDKRTNVSQYLYEVEPQAFYSLVIACLSIMFSGNLYLAVFCPISWYFW